MSRPTDIKRLEALAQLVLDQRLQALKQSADRLERSRAQLQAINAGAAPAELPPVAAGLVDVAYRRWADLRRTELNGVIARQTVDWIEDRNHAGAAFGRVQALRGALSRLERKR